MKKLLLILLIGISFVNIGVSHAQTNLKEFNLNGKVKTIRDSSYLTNKKPVSFGCRDDAKTTTVFFNEDGNITAHPYYASNDGLNNKIKVKYDEKGNIVEYIKIDTVGHKTDWGFSYTSKYDKEGKILEMVRHVPRHNKHFKIVYLYKNGFLVEEKIYDINDSGEVLNYKKIYKNDSKGNHLETLEINSRDTVIAKEIKTYDTKKNLIELTYYELEKNGLIETYYCKTDSNGNRLEVKGWGEEYSAFRTIIEYNKQNNKTKETYYKKRGKKIGEETYKYEFDNNKNWVKRTSLHKGKPCLVVFRSITYYDTPLKN